MLSKRQLKALFPWHYWYIHSFYSYPVCRYGCLRLKNHKSGKTSSKHIFKDLNTEKAFEHPHYWTDNAYFP